MSRSNREVIQRKGVNGRRDIAEEMISELDMIRELDDSNREYPKWNRGQRTLKK